MNKDRLKLLADYLEGKGKFKERGVPKEKFDLEHWMASYSYFNNPHFNVESKAKRKKFIRYQKGSNAVIPVDCQTAGCAVGWAATIPEFIDQGFYLIKVTEISAAPMYDNNLGDNAVMRFFDINITEYSDLFLPSAYEEPTRGKPEIVGKRIREFIKNKKS